MILTSKEKNYLLKNNLYIYFIVDKVVPKCSRSFIFNLYSFYKTLSGYLALDPINQEGYFNFKDRYYKAVSGIYIMDRFIAEEYVLMWVSLEQLLGRKYSWQEWTNTLMSIKDRDLSSACFNEQSDLDSYVNGHENLGSAFVALLGWEENVEQPCRRLAGLFKYQFLILKVKEHTLSSRRYLPLLDTGLLSISEIELIRKPEAFKELIRTHLNMISDGLQEILLQLPNVKKKRRAVLKALIYEMQHVNKRIYQEPQALFTKSPSYFKVSLRRLSFFFFWCKIVAFFQK